MILDHCTLEQKFPILLKSSQNYATLNSGVSFTIKLVENINFQAEFMSIICASVVLDYVTGFFVVDFVRRDFWSVVLCLMACGSLFSALHFLSIAVFERCSIYAPLFYICFCLSRFSPFAVFGLLFCPFRLSFAAVFVCRMFSVGVLDCRGFCESRFYCFRCFVFCSFCLSLCLLVADFSHRCFVCRCFSLTGFGASQLMSVADFARRGF